MHFPDKAVATPISCTVVLGSSMKWTDKLVTMVKMSKSGDQLCPVVLKSEHVIRKDQMYIVRWWEGFTTEWYSDPFYTHNKGYKMCLFVDAAGHGQGKGTHLSVFLYLMKGPHDDELTWPLKGKFEIKLLNQISNCEHHSWTLTYDNNIPDDYTNRVTEESRSKQGWGCPQYISNEDLHRITPRCQFLKDDCLFFQVTKL